MIEKSINVQSTTPSGIVYPIGHYEKMRRGLKLEKIKKNINL